MRAAALLALAALAKGAHASSASVGVAADNTPKGWLNASTYHPMFATSGWLACYLDYPLGSSVVATPVWGASGGGCISTASSPHTSPAPCWNNASPNNFANGTVFNGAPVPHFLDFSSILRKDTHGVVTRVPVAPGNCLPGNMVNVRTSAISYPALAAAGGDAPKPVMDPKTNVYSTTTDGLENSQLSEYQPRSNNAKITVYFALNYGLRNALDNPYSSVGANATSGKKYVNGGYYVSNLTTALLGDDTKNLGRAYLAEIKLCYAPMSILDRSWRKKSGDAVRNKQCLQLIKRFVPEPATTGLAVNDVPLPGYVNPATNQPAASPVAFCRPGVNASFPSGVHPERTPASGAAQYDAAVNNAAVNGPGVLDKNCVLAGESWKVTKGNNVNNSDPDWYAVDYEFPVDTPTAVYFVRVFVRDIHGNYLGFGSSATSANLTNANAQNFFRVKGWNPLRSHAVRGASVYDIEAGAIGCSLATVFCGAAFFAVEHIKAKRAARGDTEVVEDTPSVKPSELAAGGAPQ